MIKVLLNMCLSMAKLVKVAVLLMLCSQLAWSQADVDPDTDSSDNFLNGVIHTSEISDATIVAADFSSSFMITAALLSSINGNNIQDDAIRTTHFNLSGASDAEINRVVQSNDISYSRVANGVLESFSGLTAADFASGTMIGSGITLTDDAKLNDASVLWFADNQITGASITDGSISGAAFSDITNVANTLVASRITDGTLGLEHLATDALNAGSAVALLQAGAITSEAVVDGAIDQSHILDASVQGAHFGANLLQESQSDVLMITGASILANSLVEASFDANTITAANIGTGVLSVDKINADVDFLAAQSRRSQVDSAGVPQADMFSLIDGAMAALAISSDDLATGSVTATAIADEAITSLNIERGQIYGSARYTQNAGLSNLWDAADWVGTGFETVTNGEYMSHFAVGAVNSTHIENASLSGYSLNLAESVASGDSANRSVAANTLFDSYYGESDFTTTDTDTQAAVLAAVNSIDFADDSRTIPDLSNPGARITDPAGVALNRDDLLDLIVNDFVANGRLLQDQDRYYELFGLVSQDTTSMDYALFQQLTTTLDLNFWMHQEVGSRSDVITVTDQLQARNVAASEEVSRSTFGNSSVRSQTQYLNARLDIPSQRGLRPRVNALLDTHTQITRSIALAGSLADASIPYGSKGSFSLAYANVYDKTGVSISLASRVGASSIFSISASSTNDGEETLFRTGYDVSW